ncbi:M14 family metallopeptidase [Virgibacillus ihumii]|uniref:M14 family metallopeptidase n=1 Tax=Virgibacillus ihumii TaxID=2686091 RepID=UPI00157D3C6F|nr:M14 family metallocarboxypeptidase [Virgibacillus ihumii]
MTRKSLTILFPLILILSVLFGSQLVGEKSAEPNKNENHLKTSDIPVAGQMGSDFTPYFGKKYDLPEQVEWLYPSPDIEFKTPGFKEGKKNFTTQREMMSFLRELDSSSDLMKMKTAGKSLEGRALPVLILSTSHDNKAEFKDKTTVMLEGQVHGDEPTGGESVLVMAQKLAKGKLGQNVLDKINVVLVPRINPDGSRYFQRQTANRLDANRDHIKMELPEIRTLHKIFNHYQPEVVISAHGYLALPSKFPNAADKFPGIGDKGALPYHDILLAPDLNLNIPESVRNKAVNWFIKPTHKKLKKNGFYSYPYYLMKKSAEKPTVTGGSLAAGIDTNAYGLQPAFTILVESRGYGLGRETFKRRVAASVNAHTNLIKMTAKRATAIESIIENAKAKITREGKKIGEKDKIVLDFKRQELPGQQHLKVVDIAEGAVEEIPVDFYSSINAVPTEEIVRPTAYIMPPAYHKVAKKLKLQGVDVKRLDESKTLTVGRYKVTDKKVDEKYYQGHLLTHVETNIKQKKYQFPEGSYVFSSAQPTANLIALALEPESPVGYVTYNYLPVNIGDVVPVFRYMKEGKIVEK